MVAAVLQRITTDDRSLALPVTLGNDPERMRFGSARSDEDEEGGVDDDKEDAEARDGRIRVDDGDYVEVGKEETSDNSIEVVEKEDFGSEDGGVKAVESEESEEMEQIVNEVSSSMPLNEQPELKYPMTVS